MNENCLNQINNIFDSSSTSRELLEQKCDAAQLTFTTKSNTFNTNELTGWLAELLEKNNGEMILTLETTNNSKKLSEALKNIEKKLEISITILREKKCFESQDNENNEQNKCVIDFLIRRNHNSDDFIEVRVAIVGNVGKYLFLIFKLNAFYLFWKHLDSGKSTLLGVLTHNMLDNGRGEARVKIFKVTLNSYKI